MEKLSKTVASTTAIDILQAAIEALPGGSDAILAALETPVVVSNDSPTV